MKEIILAVYNCSGIFHDEKTDRDVNYKNCCLIVGHFDNNNICNYITTQKAVSGISEKIVGHDIKDCFYDRHGRVASFR